MLDALETLLTLADAGTMGRAATRLRVTQSAVSKRIASLESALGATLLERSGRNVRLTPVALELASRAQPLLSELRAALSGQAQAARGRLVVGVSESILSAWGPAALAIVAGAVESGESLWCEPLLEEEMVLLGVPSEAVARRGNKRARTQPAALHARSLSGGASDAPALRGGAISVLTIERRSATFRALAPQLIALRAVGVALEVGRELESFAAVVQLGRHGFGPALVPWPLPPPGLSRPVSLVGRKSALVRPSVAAFRAALLHAVSSLR
jgi:DNA-binding transcriptional LysR family regulator